MIQFDTIVASATAPGRGAISVIRLSGPQSVQIAELCSHKTFTPRLATYGGLYAGESHIDSGLWLYFPNPSSFTGEDVVEFQGHGGPIVIQAVIDTMIRAGARLARPGEFTERAFLNGKIDLTQAEAISDLISASSIEAVKAANRSLAGEFGHEIQLLMDQVIHLRTHLEAHIDFPDEDISPQALTEFGTVMSQALQYLASILEKANLGAKLNQASDLVLIGAPNAGKSSLLNTLAREPLAIVTDIPGTTRDLIRHHIVTHGLELRITDTAGIRVATDTIEQEGIIRARKAIETADLLICLFDESHDEISENDLAALLGSETITSPLIVVRNKKDLSCEALRNTTQYPHCEISAKTGEGIDHLLSQIRSQLNIVPREDVYLARTRHIQLLAHAQGHLQTATTHPLTNEFLDLIAEDLRLAQNNLSEITGAFSSDDLLSQIFSSFCIGK